MTKPNAMIYRLVLFSLGMIALVQANSMYIVEAGKNGEKGPTLNDGFKVCPKEFSSKGISVVCDFASSYAEFFVNGVWERREGVIPFTIAGDSGGYFTPWTKIPSGNVEIRCDGDGVSISAKGSFDCETSNPATEPTEPMQEAPVTESTVTETEPVQPMEPVGIDSQYCVTIPALSYDKAAGISDEWKKLSDGSLSYLPNNDRTWTVGPGKAPVKYKFTVPIASTYGITMDSRTPHKTEHNDVWITFDSITLRGKDKETGERVVKTGITTPLKAYQNSAGRVKIAVSVDFNPHTFSTTEVLVPGKEYTITLGARSTKIAFYGFILFPCAGEECVLGQNHWQQYIERCNV